MPPTLIHLNGPPAVGKSTLAALWAERHPGTLDLDIDRLHPLVGGWRDGDGSTHDVLRPVALAMAAAHLAGGRDVVLPQLLTTTDEIEAFARGARHAGAAFVEVVLLPDRAEALRRFARRSDASEWDEYNRALVNGLGGAEFLATLHDRLRELLASRPSAVVVPTEPDAIEATYAALEQAFTS